MKHKFLSGVRDFMARMKFMITRGQQYLSLIFWAFTMSNLMLLNLSNYFKFNIWVYLCLSVVGVISIFTLVWFVGFLDIKLRMYSAESQYQQVNTPIFFQTFKNTERLIELLEKPKK